MGVLFFALAKFKNCAIIFLFWQGGLDMSKKFVYGIRGRFENRPTYLQLFPKNGGKNVIIEMVSAGGCVDPAFIEDCIFVECIGNYITRNLAVLILAKLNGVEETSIEIEEMSPPAARSATILP
jgi:hypothetical protein